MDDKICDTPITQKYLSQCFRKSLGEKAILKSVTGELIAAGHGYVSQIIRAKLTWESNGTPDLPETVIIKIPTEEKLSNLMEMTDEMKNNMANGVTVFHQNECDLYKLFGTDPPIPTPKCYAACHGSTKDPNVIILEDLGDKATIIPCLIDGLTFPQFLEAATVLAKLHAWSLTTSVNWRSHVADMESRVDMYEPFFASMGAGYQLAKDQYPEAFGNINPEKLKKYSTCAMTLEFANLHKKFMDDVLVHGDFWANNIMYEKRADGSVGDRLVALIDFQIALRSCPMSDFARLMSWSVSHTIRRKHMKEVLQHYYKIFKSIAGDKLTATFEQLEDVYNRQFALITLQLIAEIPVMLKVMVKRDGEQGERDKLEVINRLKAGYEDAVVTLNLEE